MEEVSPIQNAERAKKCVLQGMEKQSEVFVSNVNPDLLAVFDRLRHADERRIIDFQKYFLDHTGHVPEIVAVNPTLQAKDGVVRTEISFQSYALESGVTKQVEDALRSPEFRSILMKLGISCIEFAGSTYFAKQPFNEPSLMDVDYCM